MSCSLNGANDNAQYRIPIVYQATYLKTHKIQHPCNKRWVCVWLTSYTQLYIYIQNVIVSCIVQYNSLYRYTGALYRFCIYVFLDIRNVPGRLAYDIRFEHLGMLCRTHTLVICYVCIHTCMCRSMLYIKLGIPCHVLNSFVFDV